MKVLIDGKEVKCLNDIKVIYDDAGNFVIEYFDGEKWGDDEILFDTIAPFIDGGEHGGLITVHGEENEKWRYVFENGDMREEKGIIVWE